MAAPKKKVQAKKAPKAAPPPPPAPCEHPAAGLTIVVAGLDSDLWCRHCGVEIAKGHHRCLKVLLKLIQALDRGAEVAVGREAIP